MKPPKAPADAVETATPDPDTPVVVEQQPTGGGSWVRQDDGTLTRRKD